MARQHGILRLYVEVDLAAGAVVMLDRDRAHYVATVLRARPGDILQLFNGRVGEWQGRLTEIAARAGRIEIEVPLRPQPDGNETSDIWLAFALVKRATIELLVRQATELGVARLMPVTTERSQPGRLNGARLRAIAVGAAEQCGALLVPAIDELQPFAELLDHWPATRHLAIGDERGRGTALAEIEALRHDGGLGLMIGPEGGFGETELDVVAQTANLSLFDLGPRILRADTAAAAALAIVQGSAPHD